MLKIVFGVVLAAVALGVFFLGMNAVLVVVGVGVGVAFAELIDLGTRLEAAKRIVLGGEDEDEPRARR